MGKLVEAFKHTRGKKWVKSTMYQAGPKEGQLCLAGLVYESLGFTPVQSLSLTQQDKLRNAIGTLDGASEFINDGDTKLCDTAMRLVAETVAERHPWVMNSYVANGYSAGFENRKNVGRKVGSESFIIKFNDAPQTTEEQVREVLEVALGKAKLADV